MAGRHRPRQSAATLANAAGAAIDASGVDDAARIALGRVSLGKRREPLLPEIRRRRHPIGGAPGRRQNGQVGEGHSCGTARLTMARLRMTEVIAAVPEKDEDGGGTAR